MRAPQIRRVVRPFRRHPGRNIWQNPLNLARPASSASEGPAGQSPAEMEKAKIPL